MADTTMLAAALEYVSRGWAVFPVWAPTPDGGCTCGEPTCEDQGKHPVGYLAPHGLKDATTDPAIVRGWWKRMPNANIGVAAGASGLCIIDIDTRDNVNGFATWEQLKAQHPDLTDDTVTALTGGGGLHLFYTGAGGQKFRAELGPGVDVKSNGGYIVAPPSRHKSGGMYLFDRDHDPAQQPVAPIPPVLEQLLTKPAPPAPPPPPQPAVLATPGGTVIKRTAGSHVDDLRKAEAALGCLASWRADDYAADGAWLQVGMALRELEDRGLALWEAWSRQSAKYEPEVCAAKWETFTPGGDGKGRGLGSLIEWAKQDDPAGWARFLETQRRATSATTTQTGGEEQPAADKKTKTPAPTDDELAARWLQAHPLTAWGLGEFRRYKGGVWPVLPLDTVRREIKAVLEGAKYEGIRPTARLLSSVLELARVEIAQPAEVWDADIDILVCANGALHIPTGTLQAHSPKHLATSRLAFAYDPAAVAPVWQAVLARCVPDAGEFLQEFAGYALTADTRHEVAVWLAGQPGGGKSTILAGFEAMLGARVLASLGLADIEKSRFALTNLPGKTLAISTEQPGGYLTASTVLNAIISGEPITVDRKFRDPVTIVPRAKVMWALNELPRVGADGVGLFRRVKVVKLPPIPEAERDPNVKEQVKQEGAGILNWALEGLARLRQRGRFEIPQVVKDATDHFRQTNDIPAVFVAECCVTGVNETTKKPYRAQSSVLYAAYTQWCKDNGHKPQSATSIADDWARLGFEKKPIDGRMWWHGVGMVVEGRAQASTTQAPENDPD